MAEGFFNSAVALESWSVVVLLRGGSTLMHCLGSGLMGLGWYYLLRTRRPWHILGTYAASVGLHVLWNVGAIGMAAISLGMMASDADKVSLALMIPGLLIALPGLALMLPSLRRVARRLDYAEYGGALLMGVNGAVVVGHGRSNSKAVKNAINQARKAVQGGVVEVIRNGVAKEKK